MSDGIHNLTIWVRDQDYLTTYIPFWAALSKTITFIVDTTVPTITVPSPENRTYKTYDPLNFTVNEPFSKVTYTLDGQENMIINENTTLTGLSNGDHNVTVYSTDEDGNTGASETLYCIIDAPERARRCSAVSLLVYFKKCHR